MICPRKPAKLTGGDQDTPANAARAELFVGDEAVEAARTDAELLGSGLAGIEKWDWY